jgi:hypothetical protein
VIEPLEFDPQGFDPEGSDFLIIWNEIIYAERRYSLLYLRFKNLRKAAPQVEGGQ